MNTKTAKWNEKWFSSVADGSSTMSQWKLSSIESKGGGLREVAKVAKKKRIHLVLVEDDKGDRIVAASTKLFKTIS